MTRLNVPWPFNYAYNFAYGYRDYLPAPIKKVAKDYVRKQYVKQSQMKSLSLSLSDRIEQLYSFNDGIVVIDQSLKSKMPSNLSLKTEFFSDFLLRKKFDNDKFYLILNTKDRAFFTHVINNLEGKNLDNINFLFFGDYEFAGGVILAPKGSFELNYSIFNHFSDYHGVNDRLLFFKLEYKNNKVINIRKEIINPKVLISGKINSKNMDEMMAVSYFTVNHRLSSRHERWRAQFDILYRDSVTTNHAGHDFTIENKDVAFYAPQIKTGKLDGIVMHPEISSNGFDHFLETNYKKHINEKFLPELFKNTTVKNFGTDLIKLKHLTCFYFMFSDNKTIASNHLMSRKPQASWPPDKYNEAKKLARDGIIFNLFCLPVLVNKDFDLGVFWPEIISELDIVFQLYSSKEIKKLKLNRENSTVFPHKLFNIKKNDVILIYPDYDKEDLEYSALTGPDMIIKNNKTNDWDMTEFQSSWRNQQFHNPELPHWLGRQKSLNPSCNLSGVFNSDIFEKGYITLVAVPPKISKTLSGNICIKIYLRDGTLHKVINRSFTSPMEVFELDVEKNQRYWFNIRCFEIDFNGNIIQLTKNGSVSVQHLWGY